MITQAHAEAFFDKYAGFPQVDLPNTGGDRIIAVQLANIHDGSLGVFAMLVDRITPHVHHILAHTYVLVSGALQLNRLEDQGIPNRLRMIATPSNPMMVAIHRNQAHVAWAVGNEPAEIIVIAQPGNLWEDFHSVTESEVAKLMNGHTFD